MSHYKIILNFCDRCGVFVLYLLYCALLLCGLAVWS